MAHLQEDIKQLCIDKDQLSSELRKLHSTVEDALKTKENYRSTIRQLREQNVTLEGQLNTPENAQKPGGAVKVCTLAIIIIVDVFFQLFEVC